ncbi:MAG: DUF4838 domain-containing protein [Clostridia bacterium]|nr:DUF4838 domain-containing protein [Clostridia bacterium]
MKTSGEGGAGKLKITFSVTEFSDDDLFVISADDGGISVTGGKRGLIYGVYEIYARAGWQFYAKGVEVFPEKDVFLTASDISIKETTPVKYREVLGNSSGNSSETFLKYRFNTNFWSHKLKEEDGDGIRFAGVPAHSITGEYNLKDYAATHPEYFSLKDGVRITDRMGQLCFSNENAINAVVEASLKILRENAGASYISVTPGDNNNFCECENCKKLYEKYSLSDIFVNLANKVAGAIKDEFPKVKVHIFAYGKLQDPPKTVGPAVNVIIQYCYCSCKRHAFTDDNCPVNKQARKKFEDWTKNAENVLLWDYANCFKYEMVNLPSLSNIVSEFHYYKDHKFTGTFFEYIHMDKVGSSVFAELKTYLLSKLMWKPDMQENEFNGLIDGFLAAYYGKSGEYIRKYISLYENSIRKDLHFSYDLLRYMPALNGTYTVKRAEDGGYDCALSDFFDEDAAEGFFKEAFALWDKALSVAKGEEKERVYRDRLQILYLYDYILFDKVMNSGGEEDKKLALSRNKELIDGIIKYNLRITFWGRYTDEMHAELKNCYGISSAHWNYKW